MFLQYAVPGAWVPLLTVRLQQLKFTPVEIGWTCATQALASLVAPLAAGQIADRWQPPERCLAICAFWAAGMLWITARLTAPSAVFWGCFATWIGMAPAITLSTSVAFAHLARPERDYGSVRLWGTVGWVVPGWVLGYWFQNPPPIQFLLRWLLSNAPESELADIFRLAAMLAAAVGFYALTLPPTPPQRESRYWLAPLAALHLLRERNFAVVALVCLGWCLTVPFTSQVTPLLLHARGIPNAWLPQVLTIGQAAEIGGLAVLPILFFRLGQRGTMLLGLSTWTLMLVILGWAEPLPLVAGSLLFSGLCVCCFLVSSQVFVNHRAPIDVRASAQALLSFFNGVGMLAGNLLVGFVRREVNGTFRPTYTVGAAIGLILVIVFFFGFDPDADDKAHRARKTPMAPDETTIH